MTRLLSLFLVISVVLTSCGPKVVYDKTVDVNEKGWNYEEVKGFTFNITDTLQKYHMYLTPKHSADFGFENMYIKVQTIFPTKDTTENIVSLNLTDRMGSWVGTCRSGECSPKILLKGGTRFLEGEYTLSISQHSRETNLEGIHSLQLRVEEAE